MAFASALPFAAFALGPSGGVPKKTVVAAITQTRRHTFSTACEAVSTRESTMKLNWLYAFVRHCSGLRHECLTQHRMRDCIRNRHCPHMSHASGPEAPGCRKLACGNMVSTHAACRARMCAELSSRASTEWRRRTEEEDGKGGRKRTSGRSGDTPNADHDKSNRRLGSWLALANQVSTQALAGKASHLTGGLPNLCRRKGPSETCCGGGLPQTMSVGAAPPSQHPPGPSVPALPAPMAPSVSALA